MRRLGVVVLAAWVLFSLPAEAVGKKKKVPDGLIEHSRSMIALETKIIEKLEADAAAWKSAMVEFERNAKSQLVIASTERHRLERAGMALDLRRPFASVEARQAVLLQLAQVDLAIDDLAQAQMKEIRRLNKVRSDSLGELIGLMKRVRGSQVELLAYLEDPSLRKTVGQIDVGLIATAVAEARRVRAELSDSREPVDFAAEKARIETKLTEARNFLAVLEEAAGALDSGGDR